MTIEERRYQDGYFAGRIDALRGIIDGLKDIYLGNMHPTHREKLFALLTDALEVLEKSSLRPSTGLGSESKAEIEPRSLAGQMHLNGEEA